MSESPARVVMGLDPGSRHAGYGLIEARGARLALVAAGRVSAPAAWPFPRRLAHIHLGLKEIIARFNPEAVAIEDVFSFKNPRSALRLAQARGVAVLAAALLEIPVFEYAPHQLKSAVAGHGQAEKSQVAYMVGQILGSKGDLPPDASDALAAAICHASQKTLHTALNGHQPSSSAKWSSLNPADLEALGYKIAK
jgi:crossover junction endodeoxyribonuclease RuvC